MFKVTSTNVALTRGDSATLCANLMNADGSAYELQDGDTLVLTVKDDASISEHIFQLTADGEGVFTFLPSTTEGMAFGSYKYDIQLTTSDGDVYTVIPVSTFTVMEEVTWSASAGE